MTMTLGKAATGEPAVAPVGSGRMSGVAGEIGAVEGARPPGTLGHFGAPRSGGQRPRIGLPVGRIEQRSAIAALLDGARAGRGGALVLRGERGSGKSLLLDDAVSGATDCRVLRATGIEVERDLAFGTLQQLCGPLVGLIGQLPSPQKDALSVAFGLMPGPSADPFLVGVAVVSLLAAAAAEDPVICLIDDAESIDADSGHALGFAARRCAEDGVAFVFAVGGGGLMASLVGLDEVRLPQLSLGESQLLLTMLSPGRFDPRVRDRILEESRGNPLVIHEFVGSSTAVTSAGGYAVPGHRCTEDLADSVRSLWQELSADVARVLLLAATEPLGDVGLLRKALASAGTTVDDRRAAEQTRLVQVGDRVVFAHPVARHIVYSLASDTDRRDAHRVLAEVCDSAGEADHAAWHRGIACTGRSEETATELERLSEMAGRSGGFPAAAAFLERSASLSEEPSTRSRRALNAAMLKHRSGALEDAICLVDAVEHDGLGKRDAVKLQLVRAEVSSTSGSRTGPRDLMLAAGRLASADPALSTETQLRALAAASISGRFGVHGGLHEVAAHAASSPLDSDHDAVPSQLLRALASWWSGEDVSDHRALAEAVARCCQDLACANTMATRTAMELWDSDAWTTLACRHVDQARRTGEIVDLPVALDLRACLEVLRGEFGIADGTAAEAMYAAARIGTPSPELAAMLLAAWRSNNTDTFDWVDVRAGATSVRGNGASDAMLDLCRALVLNASGRYDQALVTAESVMRRDDPFVSAWAAPEIVEAAVRSGRPGDAAQAMECIRSASAASRSDWAIGLERRCAALLADGHLVEDCFDASTRHLERAGMTPDLGRTHLLYGEWLRRQKRRVDARVHLRIALGLFDSIGASAFAARASLELRASGEQARRRSPETLPTLTERESQIADLAISGLSNPEIGTQLFISSRTVEYHLHKVFSKLGISSRAQLSSALRG